MAEWIPYDKSLSTKPEILRMTQIMAYPDRRWVVGLCLEFWSWADSITEDGKLPGMTVNMLDSLIGQAGFTNALLSVGWLREYDDGYVIPNYERWLGQNSKRRLKEARRKELSRPSE